MYVYKQAVGKMFTCGLLLELIQTTGYVADLFASTWEDSTRTYSKCVSEQKSCVTAMVVRVGCTTKSLSPISRSQAWTCGPPAFIY